MEQQQNVEAQQGAVPLDCKVRPLSWACFTENGRCIIWSTYRKRVQEVAEEYGRPITTMCDMDVAEQQIAKMRDALAGVLPYMEAAEDAGLVGDEGCHWPVELVREALSSNIVSNPG